MTEMSHVAETPEEQDFLGRTLSTEGRAVRERRARTALMRRLADVVSLPSSRINGFERAATSNLLVETLSDATVEERKRVATRVAKLPDIPQDLACFFLLDEIEIAAIMLDGTPLQDSDLIICARQMTLEHRIAITKRREVSQAVSDVLVANMEPAVIEAALRNPGVALSLRALEVAVSLSRTSPKLPSLILRRPELKPAQAYVMFWWCGAEDRRVILQRFAIGRESLQEISSDVFTIAAAENWSDPTVRKALQFVERRQRNRVAAERSPYKTLEGAVTAAKAGLTRTLVREIGFMCGLKPATAAKIFSDPTGEALAVLCKATGLKRDALISLWIGMRQPDTTASGDLAPALGRTLETFDIMAVDRAQTVLRYWNWALTSALTPALIDAARAGEEDLGQLSLTERSAILAFGLDKST